MDQRHKPKPTALSRRLAFAVTFMLVAVVLTVNLTGCRSQMAPQRRPEPGQGARVQPAPPVQQPGGYLVPPLAGQAGQTGQTGQTGQGGQTGQAAPAPPIVPPAPPQRPAPYDGNVPSALADGAEKGRRPPEDTELSRVYPGLVFRFGNPRQRLVALTFDDAPDNRFTPQILDVLKASGTPATFFLVGSRADQYPEVVARMAAEGHALGNHTYSHARLTRLTPDRVTLELEQTRRVIKRITGLDTHLFRPPYGAEDATVLHQIFDLGYKVVLWDVDSLDWKSLPKEQVIDNDLTRAHNGAIFLHHGAGGTGEDLSGTVQALPVIIQRLTNQGYRFVTIPQLLGISE